MQFGSVWFRFSARNWNRTKPLNFYKKKNQTNPKTCSLVWISVFFCGLRLSVWVGSVLNTSISTLSHSENLSSSIFILSFTFLILSFFIFYFLLSLSSFNSNILSFLSSIFIFKSFNFSFKSLFYLLSFFIYYFISLSLAFELGLHQSKYKQSPCGFDNQTSEYFTTCDKIGTLVNRFGTIDKDFGFRTWLLQIQIWE